MKTSQEQKAYLTVYISADQKTKLELLSRQTDSSVSRCIRKAIDLYLSKQVRGDSTKVA